LAGAVPLVEPVVHQGVAVFEADGKLGGGEGVVLNFGEGQFPDGFEFSVDLADDFAAGYQNVAIGEFFGGPDAGDVEFQQFLAVKIVFAEFAHIEVGDQDGAGFGEAGMAEVAVDLIWIAHGQDEFLHHGVVFFVHHDEFGGVAVLQEQNQVLADGLGSMGFGAFGSVVVPDHFFVGGYLGDAELVGKKDVAVREHHGVADFAFGGVVGIGPGNFAAADNVHGLGFGFAGVEKVEVGEAVAGQDSGG